MLRSMIFSKSSCTLLGGAGQRTVMNFSFEMPGMEPALPAANACTFDLNDGNERSAQR